MSNRFIPPPSIVTHYPIPFLSRTYRTVQRSSRSRGPLTQWGPPWSSTRNPRASPSKIKDANVKDAISREPFLQDSAHPDRSSSIRSELWCLPMSAILDHKLTTSRWTSGEPTSRALPAARHSFFFTSLSRHPLSCHLYFFFSLTQSRTLAHAGWPTWRRIRPV